MRGIFFQKPLEFEIVTEGESWSQGSLLRGTIRVRNRDAAPSEVLGGWVHLVYGLDKKVKLKAEDAFEKVNGFELPRLNLDSGQQTDALSWEFQLDPNAPITDKAGSLYLVYGQGESLSGLGVLQLRVVPRQVVRDFLEMMTTTFRFVSKGIKTGKNDSVEIKLAPPSGQAHLSIDHLVLQLGMSGEKMKVDFIFHVKGIDASSGALTIKKSLKKKECEFSQDQYLLNFNQRLNKERMEKVVEEALASLR